MATSPLDVQLDQRLPGLASALAHSADPEGAPALALGILEALSPADRVRLAEHAPAARRALACICGAAPFLARFLAAHPDLLLPLVEDDLERERSSDEYAVRLERALAAPSSTAESSRLRLFKYAELARITVRELSVDLVPPAHTAETLAELSHLADALLARALTSARAAVAAEIGAPRWQASDGDFEPRFCALGLGKLGGEELNYSSDVDLIYIYESHPAAAPPARGPQGLAPAEYFTKVGQAFGHLVVATNAEGFLYRIDLDLRPEGAAGPLVISSDELANYYDVWAATWEKAAFMKARPVAGDLDFGWQTIRAIDPMIYRSSMDFAGVAAIREMKERVEKTRGRDGATFDVKVGEGGIRDVEFVAQALQLLHGGRIPQVRDRSTQRTLERLGQVSLLADRDVAELLDAYRFLRRVENRIQMAEERQTHRLPTAAGALARLARASGFVEGDAGAAFDEALQAHRRRIQRVFAAVFPAAGGSRVMSLFERNAPQLLANPLLRRRIEELAERFAHGIEGSPNPERALNNLDRFIQGVGMRSFYYNLLLDRSELVPRLCNLFAASEYLSTYLANHPRLIEPIFSDPNVLLLSQAELDAELQQIRDELAGEASDLDDVEAWLDALRLFHNRELLNIGLLDLSAKVSASQAEAALTELAEVCLRSGLELAQHETQRRREAGGTPLPSAASEGEFLIVGMGKLASRELTYGSDLDVIFVYDLPAASEDELREGQEYFVRVAQKLIWALQTRTREGVCYQIDARLRPSGNQGTLVVSLPGLRRHHRRLAMVWERQALLRARPVAGSDRLAEAYRALRLEVLQQPPPADLATEIRRIRQRVEHELARETHARHDFKTGRGGLMDVESVVQYLQLRHGNRHPPLFEVERTETHVDRLAALDLLAQDDAAVLRQGWVFLQRLSSRLRIVENRSISDLDEERGDLEDLAQQLGYDASQRASAARRSLLDDYRRHTAAVRAVYERVLANP